GGEGERAGEGGGGEADEAGGVLGTESGGAFVGRLDARLEHTGDGLAGAGLHPDGGKGVVGRVAFVGAVEDFPVAELTASAEGDGTGGDASEGEGDGGEVSRGEDAGIGDVGGDRRGGGRRDGGLGGGFGLGGGAGEGHLLEESAALGGHQVKSALRRGRVGGPRRWYTHMAEVGYLN